MHNFEFIAQLGSFENDLKETVWLSLNQITELFQRLSSLRKAG